MIYTYKLAFLNYKGYNIRAFEGGIMKIIDLSYVICQAMPVYPGDVPPKIKEVSSIEKDGFLERELTLSTHTGTHIDAPSHILSMGKTISDFSLEKFRGMALLIDIEDKIISLEKLVKYKLDIEKSDYVIFRTGWSKYWGKETYYTDYPTLEKKAASWLGSKNIKGIGVDTISVDVINSKELIIHKMLLKEEILIIENLANLEKIEEKQFELVCAPLKIKDSDGAPASVFAIIY